MAFMGYRVDTREHFLLTQMGLYMDRLPWYLKEDTHGRQFMPADRNKGGILYKVFQQIMGRLQEMRVPARMQGLRHKRRTGIQQREVFRKAH